VTISDDILRHRERVTLHGQLERQSLYNLVWYYRSELRELLQGRPSGLSETELRNLRKHGALKLHKNRGVKGGFTFFVTDDWLKLLEELPP
jgi:hypothetical protein